MVSRTQETEDYYSSFKPDCENCFGLCCVALPFSKSVEFAEDKEGGKPCKNLGEDNRCGIHQHLRTKGYKGCTVFECFGAGQKVSQLTFKGADWRDSPDIAKNMFKVFPIMQQLHEMLCYLDEALQLKTATGLTAELSDAFNETKRLSELEAEEIIDLYIPAHRAVVGELLIRTSELLRQKVLSERGKPAKGRKKKKGSDLIGAKLRNQDLRGESFRGAWLIAADLRNADLRNVDFIGADLRDADIRGADLTGSIFLTQIQLNAAKGDMHTKIPPAFTKPAHWTC